MRVPDDLLRRPGVRRRTARPRASREITLSYTFFPAPKAAATAQDGGRRSPRRPLAERPRQGYRHASELDPRDSAPRAIRRTDAPWPTTPSSTTTTWSTRAPGRWSARSPPSVMAIGCVIWMKGLFGLPKGTWWVFAARPRRRALHHVRLVADVVKEANQGDHTPVVSIGLRYGMILFIASEVMFFVAWFWIFFEMALFHEAPHARRPSRRSAPPGPPGRRKGVETARRLAPAAGQHPDPAALGHHRHLGAPRAAAGRPQGRQDRPGPDHRCSACCSPRSRPTSTATSSHENLFFNEEAANSRPLRLGLLHGHGLPRLPRADRHHLPDRLPAPPDGRRLHARRSTSASRRRPGTGTSSTWSGCSCSPSST